MNDKRKLKKILETLDGPKSGLVESFFKETVRWLRGQQTSSTCVHGPPYDFDENYSAYCVRCDDLSHVLRCVFIQNGFSEKTLSDWTKQALST